MSETEFADVEVRSLVANIVGLQPGECHTVSHVIYGNIRNDNLADDITAAHRRLRNRINSAIHRARQAYPAHDYAVRGTAALTREYDVVVSQLVFRVDEGEEDPLYTGEIA